MVNILRDTIGIGTRVIGGVIGGIVGGPSGAMSGYTIGQTVGNAISGPPNTHVEEHDNISAYNPNSAIMKNPSDRENKTYSIEQDAPDAVQKFGKVSDAINSSAMSMGKLLDSSKSFGGDSNSAVNNSVSTPSGDHSAFEKQYNYGGSRIPTIGATVGIGNSANNVNIGSSWKLMNGIQNTQKWKLAGGFDTMPLDGIHRQLNETRLAMPQNTDTTPFIH